MPLNEKPRPGASKKSGVKGGAYVIASAGSRPPAARKLLDHANDSRQTGATEIYGAYHGGDCSLLPKKGGLKPWLHQRWCLSKVDAAFICQMEDILELYAEALESQYPIVCWDKT